MSNWVAYEMGRSIGKVSAEGGLIMRDEEHPGGARITFKRGSGHISVSCNLYGWVEHTRFFGTTADAQRVAPCAHASLPERRSRENAPDEAKRISRKGPCPPFALAHWRPRTDVPRPAVQQSTRRPFGQRW